MDFFTSDKILTFAIKDVPSKVYYCTIDELKLINIFKDVLDD